MKTYKTIQRNIGQKGLEGSEDVFLSQTKDQKPGKHSGMEFQTCSERRDVEKFLFSGWRIYTEAQNHAGTMGGSYPAQTLQEQARCPDFGNRIQQEYGERPSSKLPPTTGFQPLESLK